MALPDITFTNNLGTLTFEQALVGLSDNWQWTSGVPVFSKGINVSGFILRGDPAIDDILTDDLIAKGERGTLTLPWTVLTNIRLNSIDITEDFWQAGVPVTAEFSDDVDGNNNHYTLTFFGLTIHNPKLREAIPSKVSIDKYANMLISGAGGLATSKPQNYPTRTRVAYGMVDVELTGGILIQNGVLPTNLFNILQQRIGLAGVTNTSIPTLPTGFPNSFDLGVAIPELPDDLKFTKAWVKQSSVKWDVENNSLNIKVTMRMQPQTLGP